MSQDVLVDGGDVASLQARPDASAMAVDDPRAVQVVGR